MKKFVFSLIIVFLLFGFNQLSKTNNVDNVVTLVVYKVGRYNSMNENSPNIKTNVTSTDKQLDLLEFQLFYDKNSSLYKLVDGVEKDEDFEAQSAKILAGGLCYKNSLTKEKIEQVNSFDELYNVIKPFDEYKWDITTESKTIDGYLCYKATSHKEENDEIRGRVNRFNPVVWFAPSIPAPFGPRGLDGLPGLILEGTINGRIYFYASKIEFDYKGKVKIEKPTKGKYVSEEELLKIDAENFKNNTKE